MNEPPKPNAARTALLEVRAELHGRRRDLHDQLATVCEDFVTGQLTRAHKKQFLVRELRYLLDFYQDEENWTGVD
jgi:hypothetical protein